MLSYLAQGARVGAMPPGNLSILGARKRSLVGASIGVFLDGTQSALNIFPKRKCCTTGNLSNTSPSYSRNNPEETFDQLLNWDISFSIGDDSKKGTFVLICCMNRIQDR